MILDLLLDKNDIRPSRGALNKKRRIDRVKECLSQNASDIQTEIIQKDDIMIKEIIYINKNTQNYFFILIILDHVKSVQIIMWIVPKSLCGSNR